MISGMKRSAIASVKHRCRKIPYMLVIGDKEVESGRLSIRNCDTGEQETLKIDEFKYRLAWNIAQKSLVLD